VEKSDHSTVRKSHGAPIAEKIEKIVQLGLGLEKEQDFSVPMTI
jgi:hypothetical protein